MCLKRLAQYKPLIGTLLYQVAETETETEVSVEVLSANPELELPEILVGIEFAFLVELIRKATKEHHTAVRDGKAANEESLLCRFYRKAYHGWQKNRLVLSKEDAPAPFISRNESMWEFFEPELKCRLSMMGTDDSCAAHVRSALTELLPGGECTIDDVAKKLGYSKRSLQRKLQEEDTNFRKQLNHTRELPVKTYLAGTDMTVEDIAFLPGYQEIGSFLRTFSVWIGSTISAYRQQNC